jgi:hypothetical protein
MHLRLCPITAAALAVLAAVTMADASSGISCTWEDASSNMAIDAAFTRGLGGGMINFGAALKVLLPNAPRDLRRLAFVRKDVSQIWWYGPDFKLQVYRERPDKLPFGSVNLLVETKGGEGDDEGVYRGTYKLEISFKEKKQDAEPKTLTAQGKVECSSE